MKNVLLTAKDGGETQRQITIKIEQGTHQSSRVLAKDRLTTGGLLQTLSMTLPK